MSKIFLDYQSSTPCDPQVIEAMLPFFKNEFANSSSVTHSSGRSNQSILESCREQCAAFIGAHSRDILFTSSATESNNLALKGIVSTDKNRNNFLITSTDHPSVIHTADALKETGKNVKFLHVLTDGQIDLKQLEASLDSNTLIFSLCQGNNEIGSLHSLTEIGKICRAKGVYFHVDASQALLTEIINVEESLIDLMSFSGHKIYGPKGVGVLYRRRKSPRVRLKPQLHGGSQEFDLRAGTSNLPAIVGLNKAIQIVTENRAADKKHFIKLQEVFLSTLQKSFPELYINGSSNKRLANNINFGIPGLDSLELICNLEKIECSKGSACSIDLQKPSHVLKAIGLNGIQANECLRISFGRDTTEQDIKIATEELIEKISYQLKKNITTARACS